MTAHLLALCFDANDPLGLARFWAGVLDWEMDDGRHDGIALVPSDDTGFRIRFLSTQEEKVGQNRMHFDLTSTSLADQQETVARALGLGARHIDVETSSAVGWAPCQCRRSATTSGDGGRDRRVGA
jgi:glyoxalase superfamily protein